MNLQKIKIRPRKEGLLHGSNCVVEVDGKELQGVTRAVFICRPGEIARLRLELVGDIEIEGEAEVKADGV